MHQKFISRCRALFGPALVGLALFLIGVSAVKAMPPAPRLLEKIKSGRVDASMSIPSTSALHARGIDTPGDFFLRKSVDKNGRVQTSAATGPFRMLAICVDFSDHNAQTDAHYFDTLLFSATPGTVRSYYNEVSYSQLDLITVNAPSTMGWQRAPQTYAYYTNDSSGMGTYPHNAQKLVEYAADAVDGVVDFNNYDNDGDGFVDVLIVIHSGVGAEYTGSPNDIWSHEWVIPAPRTMNDGAKIYFYTINPEYFSTPGDMTCGVFCHELGHGFGLPDLYDTDYSSRGIGSWGIMSYGSWNGVNGSSPAHPCAWSRIQMGFASPTNVTSNMTGQAIASVESGGPIYRLWTAGASSSQYFLVENRQLTGFDSWLPGEGILIWHIDDTKTDNTEEWWPGTAASHHFLVALEQADGSYNLEHKQDYGNFGDPFPGSSGNTRFSATSSPTSDSYAGDHTLVSVENISASAATMYADLMVGIAAGVDIDIPQLPVVFDLAQNYPNPFNPGTSIRFSLTRADEVRLELFNVLGQQVKTLLDGQVDAGSHVVKWDGTDRNGQNAASGVYFYRLTVDNRDQTKKMLLVR